MSKNAERSGAGSPRRGVGRARAFWTSFALPHHHVAASGPVLEALGRLPAHYAPGALDALVVREAA